jgi:hypothetical protein
MNVNSVTPGLTTPTANPTATPASPKPVISEVAVALSDKEARAQAFYMREEEPWKKGVVHYIEGTEEKTRPMTKSEYLDHLKIMSILDIEIQQGNFDKFRNSLIDRRPDLAGKNINYSLDDNAQIKILDPDRVFSEEQREWLTESLNKLTGFRDTVQSHARKIMTLVDHDTEAFGNRYVLNLMNFADTIEYGTVMACRNQHELNDRWMNQIHEKGQLREKPLVNVHA